MSGLFGSDLSSFRPDDNSPLPSIPRRVLRHLVTNHSLGIGSKILIGGDEAEELTCFFSRLGIDAVSGDTAEGRQDQLDAAMWVDLTQSKRQSLCSQDAVERSERLLKAIKPSGTFCYIVRTAAYGAGHETKCLEAHFGQLTDHIELTVFPDRSLVGFFGGPSRSGFAVGSCKLLARAVDPDLRLQRRPLNGRQVEEACCAWADNSARVSRAA